MTRPARGVDALAPYWSPDELEAQTRALGNNDDVVIEHYGVSVQGRPLTAVIRRIDPDAPTVVCIGNIHGVEYISSRLTIALARAWLHNEADRAGHTRGANFIAIPTMNPDAYVATWEAQGDAPLAALRTNANGVDLNRNFPLPGARRRWSLPFTGSRKPGDATFRGVAPLSEPETASLDTLLRQFRVVGCVSCHSFMGRFIPPFVPQRGGLRSYRRLIRDAASTQTRVRYPVLASSTFDQFTGELEDHLHHVHGAWSVCFESFPVTASLRQHLRAPRRFWRFNPRDPDPWILNDLPALQRFLEVAIEEGPVPSALRSPPLAP